MAYQKIKGVMADGKSSRYVQVDSEGRLVKAPIPKKTVIKTKLMLATAKEAGDVVSESVTIAVPWYFYFGGTGYITKAIVAHDAAITPRLVLLLFDHPPTGELNDDVANTNPLTADAPFFVGAINCSAMTYIGTGDAYSVNTSNTPNSNLRLSFNSIALYGVLITLDNVTTVAEDLTITLEADIED